MASTASQHFSGYPQLSSLLLSLMTSCTYFSRTSVPCLLRIGPGPAGIKTRQEPADPGYRLAPHIWEQIGVETAAAYRTIPSDFVGAMPDITKSKYKAEYWSFWTIHLAPILLQRRFPNEKFYRHFCLFVDIIKLCLQFTITDAEIHGLKELIIEWVQTYER